MPIVLIQSENPVREMYILPKMALQGHLKNGIVWSLVRLYFLNVKFLIAGLQEFIGIVAAKAYKNGPIMIIPLSRYHSFLLRLLRVPPILEFTICHMNLPTRKFWGHHT